MTFPIKSTAHVVSMFVVAFLLAACAGELQRPSTPQTTAPTENAEQAAEQGDYARAAELYKRAAGRADDAQAREGLRFEAGIAAAHAGRTSMARNMLGGIDQNALSDSDRARYKLARTELRIAELPPARALSELPPPQSGTPPTVAARVWQKRAELHFAQNDWVAGIRDLVQRGVWLVDEQAIDRNDDAIYDKALNAISYGQGAESSAARSADATTRGWLALAAIGQQRWPDRNARDQALAAWERQYAGHPATREVLQSRFDFQPSTSFTQRPRPQPFKVPRPTHDTVALALPLSGDFSSAAEAIRDGFLFAYENDSGAPGDPLIYDTSEMSARDILEQARRDRAGILVGPLDKAKVAELSRLGDDIPTLALNYIDESDATPGFYRFALAPEDEARAVARHAQAKGYGRALALVPEGGWGSRVFDAFRNAFNADGGEVIDYATYDAEEHDHRDPIQSVLSAYGQGQSVDFIFVAAQPTQGRLIRSQLRFYHATRLPMLSTSHLYTGTPDPGNDIDLNGVAFADLPWVLGDGDFISRRRDAAQQRYGATAKRYSRLFAMGMDAWTLTDRIAQPGLRPGDTIEGMTGVLSVGPTGRIERYLAWAVFRDGEPQLVEMPSPSDAETSRAKMAPWTRP